MSKILKKLAALFLLSGFVSLSDAAVSPVAVGFAPPVQFPGRDFSITGLRLSFLWGVQRDLYGLDLGLIGNTTEQDFVGLAVSGLFNRTKGQTTAIGLQAAGLANINENKTRVIGAQVALGLNQNKAVSTIAGLELALANLSPHTSVYGAQLGLYNVAQVVYGVQLGLVNVTESLHGIQIGLVNFHRKGLFSVAPIINIGF